MKKVVLFTAVLLLAGAVSLSADAPKFEPAIALTGSASFTFGVNLLTGSEATGIANASSSDLTLTLVNAASDEKGGKEGEEVYGWIKLKTIKTELENDSGTSTTTINGSVDGIEAKLFLGPVYINILGLGDDDNLSKADDITSYWVQAGQVSLTTTQTAEFNGIALGLTDTSVISAVVGVSSLADWKVGTAASSSNSYAFTGTVVAVGGEVVPAGERWVSIGGVVLDAGATAAATTYNIYAVTTTAVTGDAANTNNVYNFYAGVGLTAVPNLNVEAAVNLSTGTGTALGFGAKAGYTIGIAEGISLTPSVGFDYQSKSSGNLTQLTGKVVLDLPGDDHNDWDVFGDGTDDYPTQIGVTVSTNLAATNQLDLSVYAFDGALIPVLDVLATFEAPNLGATGATLGFATYISAALGVATPWANIGVQLQDGVTDPLKLVIKVGVDLTVITNTTFSVEYDNIKTAAGVQTDNLLLFTTKIAY